MPQNVIGEMVVRVGVDTTQLDKGLAQGQNKMHGFATGMGKMGKAMMMGFTLPIAAAGIAVTKMAMDFESQMTDVYTLMDEAQVKSRDWGKAVLDLSKDVGQSSATMATGLYNIVSSGFSGAEALGILEVAAKSASAGLAETGTSVGAITAVLNAYNMEATEAAKVADILFTTVKYGVTTFPELSSAIGRVISTAAAANVSFEEVGAALAQMTLGGISTDEAVTALNQVILNFLSPTDQAVAAAARVGFKLDAVTLSTKGLGGAMAELIEKLGISADELTELERQGYSDAEMWDALAVKTGINAEIFAEIFSNVRALKGALSLASGEGERYAEMQLRMADSSGKMAEAFALQAQTAKFQFRQAIESIKAAGIELGTKFLPMATKAFNKIGELANRFSELDDATQDSIIAWAGLLAIMPIALVAISKIITGVINLRNALATLNAMQVAPWISSLVVLLPQIALATGLVALKLDDVKQSWGENEDALNKFRKATAGYGHLSILFDEVSESIKQLSASEVRDLTDAYVSGKLSAKAFADAVLYLSDRNANYILGTELAARATEKEKEVLDEIIHGTYELTAATEEMADVNAENVESIMAYRFANEELISTLSNLQTEFNNGYISAEEYQKAVQYLADTHGEFKGDITDVYLALGIMTAEEMGLAESTEKTTEVLNNQLDVVVDMEAAFDDLLKTLFELYNLNQSVTESQWAYEDALKEYLEVLKDKGATEREVTEKLFALQDAEENYINTVASGLQTEDLSAARRQELIDLYVQLGLAAIEAGETSSQKFLEVAKSAGITKTELTSAIETIGTEVDKLPKEIKSQMIVEKTGAENAMAAMFGSFTTYEESDPTAEISADTKKADSSMSFLNNGMLEYEKSNPTTKVYADTSQAWAAINGLLNYKMPTKTIPVKYSIPGYQYGGQVPGPAGIPRPAIVHGGEWIVNPFEPKSVESFIDAMSGGKQLQPATIINKFEIANLSVREEADIQKIARDLLDMQKQEQRSIGK